MDWWAPRQLSTSRHKKRTNFEEEKIYIIMVLNNIYKKSNNNNRQKEEKDSLQIWKKYKITDLWFIYGQINIT